MRAGHHAAAWGPVADGPLGTLAKKGGQIVRETLASVRRCKGWRGERSTRSAAPGGPWRACTCGSGSIR